MSVADELVDIYDPNHNLIGQAMRSQAHQEGLWHEVYHCWIIKKEEDGNKIWFQHRSKNMENFPNFLDISSGGHLRSGVKPRVGGAQEMSDELGLRVKPEEMNKLFTTTMINGRQSGLNNREFCAVYLYEANRSIYGLVLDPEAVSGIFEADFDEVYDLFLGKRDKLILFGAERNNDNSYTYLDREVTVNDFVPHGNEYYFKVFEAIKRQLSSVQKAV